MADEERHSGGSDRARGASATGRRMAGSGLLPIILCAAAFAASCSYERPPLAEGGVVDLQSWDFAAGGSVALRGEWEFYPGVLLRDEAALKAVFPAKREVPDLWKGEDALGLDGRGAGTYRLRVLLDPGAKALGLAYTTTSTSFECDANGAEVARAGLPSTDPEVAAAAYRPGVAALPEPGGYLVLAVRISNHDYRAGGMWRPFRLGLTERLSEGKRALSFRTLLLVGLIAAMALNSLVLWHFRRRDRSFLFFALFGAIVALRGLVTGDYVIVDIVPAISFNALIRLEYMTAYLVIPSGALFFTSIFPAELGRRGRAALILPCLLFFPLVPFASISVLTRSITVFYPIAFANVAAVMALVLVKATIRRSPGGLPLLIGGCVLAAAAVNDMLYSAFVVSTGNFITLGMAFFIVVQDLVLAMRFMGAFGEAEKLSAELARTNGLLEEEVRRYQEAHGRLEALLSEKETLLKEVHHRVKNSLQLVSSIITLQSHRTSSPEAAGALLSMRERIRSISLVHEKLYGAVSAEVVDLGGYVTDLAAQLASGFETVEGGGADVTVEAQAIEAPMDLCVDLGLIYSELIINAFRHAAAAGRGSVSVTLRLDGSELVSTVSDQGSGFPPGFEPGSGERLGYRIVTSLVKKRGGRLVLASEGGARVEVRLPFPETRPGDDGPSGGKSNGR